MKKNKDNHELEGGWEETMRSKACISFSRSLSLVTKCQDYHNQGNLYNQSASNM
jgi:hypothetical protein